MMIDFEGDAEALQVSDESLKSISELATKAKLLEKEIDDLQSVVDERKKQHRKLTEEILPEAILSTGMDSFTMADGSSISVQKYYSASISAARKAEAFQWLRENGFDDIIKNTVSVRFGRGEDELCDRLLGLLGTQGFPTQQAEKVEPMTLKAFVKEQIERGNALPLETFGVFIGQKVKIKT
tara:strand:- start:635 stop:1180 length:546 start_codon:yes stop_codon:yes gene_type:complete